MKFDAMLADLRREEEAGRIKAVKTAGRVPASCGDAIPDAPARGPIRVFEARALYPDGERGWVSRPAGYRGRKTLQRADAFDVMEAKARRRLFTTGQKAIGRHYSALVERHACAGMRCSSFEDVGGGGGGDAGSFIDAVLRDGEEIAKLRDRIGSGVSQDLRKPRPSKRGARISILDRRLVDAVCLEEASVSDLLRAHGYVVKGETVAAVRAALRAALDRMAGQQGGRGLRACQFGV